MLCVELNEFVPFTTFVWCFYHAKYQPCLAFITISIQWLAFMLTRKTPGFARLCSQSRFWFVGEILENLFCLDFTYSILCSWHTDRSILQRNEIAQPFSENPGHNMRHFKLRAPTTYLAFFMPIFKKSIAALKMIISKNEKHIIITKLHEKIIFVKIRKILESGFFPESGFFRIFFNLCMHHVMLIPEN